MNYKYIYTESIEGLGSELFDITRSIKKSNPFLTFTRYCSNIEDSDKYFSYFILLHYLVCRNKIGFGLCPLLDDLEGKDFKGEIDNVQCEFKKDISAFRQLFRNKPDSITTLDYYLGLLKFKTVKSFTTSRELVLWLICGLHLISDKGDFLSAASALIRDYDTVFGRLFIDIACCIFDISFNYIETICKELPCFTYTLCDAELKFEAGTLKELINASLKEYNASRPSQPVSCDKKPKRHCKISYKNVRIKNSPNTVKSPSSNPSNTAKLLSSNSPNTVKSPSSNPPSTVNGFINLEPLMNNMKNIVNRSINYANNFAGNYNSCVIGANVTMITDSSGTIINSKIRVPAGHSVSVVNDKVYVDGKLYADISSGKFYTDIDDGVKVDETSNDTKKYELTDKTIVYKGIVLHQIRALKSFGDVKKGDVGGFIESEDNLSHTGTCWVYDFAKVYGKAKLVGTSIVRDMAVVTGNIYLKSCDIQHNSVFNASGNVLGKLTMIDNSSLKGELYLPGQLYMEDSSSVKGTIYCSGQITMADTASIEGTLHCTGQISMCDNTSISGDCNISGIISMIDNTAISNVDIYSTVNLCDNAKILDSSLYSMFHLDGHRTLNNYRGCFYGT